MKAYEVCIREYGQETPVDDFPTEMEACQFIVNHKKQYNDVRFFIVNEIDVEEYDNVKLLGSARDCLKAANDED